MYDYIIKIIKIFLKHMFNSFYVCTRFQNTSDTRWLDFWSLEVFNVSKWNHGTNFISIYLKIGAKNIHWYWYNIMENLCFSIDYQNILPTHFLTKGAIMMTHSSLDWQKHLITQTVLLNTLYTFLSLDAQFFLKIVICKKILDVCYARMHNSTK